MPEHFLPRLRAYYEGVGAVLRGAANPAAVFPNLSDIGTSREQLYAAFLRQHVTASCTVSFGGFLFDQDGNESGQLDILVLDASSPQYNFHNPDGSGKAFACVDGCVAVASIKSTLGKRELRDALENIASLPDKQPIEGRINPLLDVPSYADWPYKIIYASRGLPRDDIGQELDAFYRSHAVPHEKRPNMIHVAGTCLVERVGVKGGLLRDGTALPPHAFVGQEHDTDVVALSTVITRIQEMASVARQINFDFAPLMNALGDELERR